MSELTPELQRYFRHDGMIVAVSAAISALIQTLSPEQKQTFLSAYEQEIEAAQTSFLPTALPEEFFEAFEKEAQQIREYAEP